MLHFLLFAVTIRTISGVLVDHYPQLGTANTGCPDDYEVASYEEQGNRKAVNDIMSRKNITTVWMPYKKYTSNYWMWENGTKAEASHIPSSQGGASGCAYIYLKTDSREEEGCSGQVYGYVCEGTGKACSGQGFSHGNCLVKGDRWFVYGCGVNNWYEAKYRCEQMGTKLATLDSNIFISDFKNQWIDQQKKPCEKLWYGLYKERWGMQQTSENQDDIESSTHLLWGAGQPGNVNNCSILHREKRGITSLRSADCGSEHVIICLSKKVPVTTVEPKTTNVTTMSKPVPCTTCSGRLVAIIILSFILALIVIFLLSFFIMRKYCSKTPCFTQIFGRICGSKDNGKPKQVPIEKKTLLGNEKGTVIPMGTPKTPDKKFSSLGSPKSGPEHKIMMPADDTSLHKDDTDSPGKPIQRESPTPPSEKTFPHMPSTSATISHGADFDMNTIKPAVFTNITSDTDETKVHLRVYAIDDKKKEKEIIKNIDLQEPWIRQPSYIDITLDENYKGKLTTKVEPEAKGWRITPTEETQSVITDSIFYNYKKKNMPWKLLLDRCLTGPKDSNNLVIAISYLVHTHDTMNGDWQSSTITVNLEQCTAKQDKMNKMAKDEEDDRDSLDNLNVKKHEPSIDLQADKDGGSKPGAKANAPGGKTGTVAEIHPAPSHIGAYAKVNTTAAPGDTQTASAGSRRVAGIADVGIRSQCEDNDINGHVGDTESGEKGLLPESVRLLNEEKENIK